MRSMSVSMGESRSIGCVSSNEKDGVSDCRILGGMVYSMSMEWISAKASLLSCVFAAIVNKASSAGNTGDSQRSKGVLLISSVNSF